MAGPAEVPLAFSIKIPGSLDFVKYYLERYKERLKYLEYVFLLSCQYLAINLLYNVFLQFNFYSSARTGDATSHPNFRDKWTSLRLLQTWTLNEIGLSKSGRYRDLWKTKRSARLVENTFCAYALCGLRGTCPFVAPILI